ncbi:MAG: sensor histidine kinase [Halobacteriales archaeon]
MRQFSSLWQSVGDSRYGDHEKRVATIATIGLYAAAFPAIYPVVDHLYFALGLIPIVVAGALLGLRPAIYTVLVVSGLHFVLLAGVLRRPIRSALIDSFPVVTLVIGVTVGYLRDVRTRLAQQREELERKNERLEEVAGVISHDLKNPMNVAIAKLHLALDEDDPGAVEDAVNALERMDVLIDDLLSLARAGESVGDAEPVRLPALVETCWHNVETAAADLVCDTDATVQGDRTRIRQLLENLLRNAVEHGGSDVTITIGDLSNGFYVEDDGPGIPPEHRDEVFEPGVSLSTDGTGYGLSIVREVAEAHGWDITVTAETDDGARFEFEGVEFAD